MMVMIVMMDRNHRTDGFLCESSQPLSRFSCPGRKDLSRNEERRENCTNLLNDISKNNRTLDSGDSGGVNRRLC